VVVQKAIKIDVFAEVGVEVAILVELVAGEIFLLSSLMFFLRLIILEFLGLSLLILLFLLKWFAI
jgi:hypothetical protein